ncbi:hypothetical protein STEG23_028075 [Scotinomys teguina]
MGGLLGECCKGRCLRTPIYSPSAQYDAGDQMDPVTDQQHSVTRIQECTTTHQKVGGTNRIRLADKSRDNGEVTSLDKACGVSEFGVRYSQHTLTEGCVDSDVQVVPPISPEEQGCLTVTGFTSSHFEQVTMQGNMSLVAVAA